VDILTADGLLSSEDYGKKYLLYLTQQGADAELGLIHVNIDDINNHADGDLCAILPGPECAQQDDVTVRITGIKPLSRQYAAYPRRKTLYLAGCLGEGLLIPIMIKIFF
jgi:hypothetical protein